MKKIWVIFYGICSATSNIIWLFDTNDLKFLIIGLSFSIITELKYIEWRQK